MANLVQPKSQATLNPLWLLAWAESSLQAPNAGGPDSIISPPAPPERTPIATKSVGRNIGAATRPPVAPGVAIPRLSRISSDCDLEGDQSSRTSATSYEDLRREFERSFVDGPNPSSRRTKYLSHHGYFRRQILSGPEAFVPLDPDATSDVGTSGVGEVLVDKASASIYDAYLLRVDIAKNVDSFHRQQIVFYPNSKTYTLFTREGRVGLPGTVRERRSASPKSLQTRFQIIFRQNTGVTWNQRYERPSGLGQRYQFVELDYRDRRTRASLPVEVSHRHYDNIDSQLPESVRGLLQVMLYYRSAPRQPGPAKGGESETVAAASAQSAFTAPYEHLSPWTCFLGFKALQRIYQHLDSSGPVRWKALVSASSRYRSHIPLHSKNSKTPVISSYYALFLELKFLYQFWPRAEVTIMLADVETHASLQARQYGSLSQPMYRAYSSLRHGFRRLEPDHQAVEFRELKNYMEKSCHSLHGLRLELQEIYSVFIKSNLPNPYGDLVNISAELVSLGASIDEERLLLWHGTPLDSLLGILDLGLQIRRKGASWTGTMFGNGIYFADASSKSAAFCKHQAWNGEAVLLLCEVDVGQQRIRSPCAMQRGHEQIGASFGQYRCIEGLGRIGPAKWKDVSWEMAGEPNSSAGVVRMPDVSVPYTNTYSGGVLGFNEYVVYDPSQVLIRYVLRVKIEGQK
ncbi:poly polymerase catalytic domain-containing protein [Immersiella caudata]|uniref:Poly [ADP-ribose] polymerase n=1 Tax=Immersiella caudata TaxID=314043 RepID=A0AA40C6J7_9PEZI|nr:poly polymerase catalytic domain-containing protein [Immersiella caudata]